MIHPLVMYSRMRFVLELMQPVEAVTRIGEYRELLLEDRRLPPGCPADYVAVKLYFSDSFPDDEASRALAARVLGELAERTDVVVLTSGRQLDEHREWVPEGARIHDSSSWVTPQDNLAVQTAVVAGARELVATYGGFSYLGPMLGVPTRALWTQEAFQRVHLDVLRAAYPDAELRAGGAVMIVPTEELDGLAGTVTMVSGGFDPLHPGHLAYFRAAAALGAPLLVNVSHDEWVGRKHVPLLTQAERIQVIDALEMVEYVHAEQGPTFEVLRALRPRYFAKGADWEGRLPPEELEACSEVGTEIVFLDTVVDSSTEVLRRFKERGG